MFQGTIPRVPPSSTGLVGKPGVVRMAQATGAPVIPSGSGAPGAVAAVGEGALVSLGARRCLCARADRPPVELVGESVEADTARVMAAIVDLLPPTGAGGHTPTEAELRSADPNGDLPATW